MSSTAVKAAPRRARRTTPTQFKDACERLAATDDGPVEFRSVREMDEHIKANTEPLISDEPCQCGKPRQWKHKYCDDCASKRAQKSKTSRQRNWRASL